MILTKKEILKEIKKGGIKITGFNSKYLGPASYDLALSNEFRVFKDIHVTKELSEQKQILCEPTPQRKLFRFNIRGQ